MEGEAVTLDRGSHSSPDKDNDLTVHALRWRFFEDSLRSTNRFFPGPTGFFEEAVAACLECRRPLAADTPIFRARLNPPDAPKGEPLPLDDMGAPPQPPGGRLNPEGIAYFYGSTEAETAIAELRPWPLAYVSVAEGRTIAAVTVTDLTFQHTLPRVLSSWIAHICARPTHRDAKWEYLGTQMIAERLKAEGVGGIVYHSAMRSRGTNIAFMNSAAVRLDAVVAHQVHDVVVTSAPVLEPTNLFPKPGRG